MTTKNVQGQSTYDAQLKPKGNKRKTPNTAASQKTKKKHHAKIDGIGIWRLYI